MLMAFTNIMRIMMLYGNIFENGHFLCEEGTCIDERFTSVFRTKLDLQVHTTHDHGHTMTKTEARQARTVDIAFTVNHRQGHFSDRGRGGRRGEGRGRRPQDLEEQASAAAAIPPSENIAPVHSRAIDINCVQDFPSLNGVGGTVTDGDTGGGGGGGASNTKSIAHKLAQQNRFTIRTTRGHALDEEEFPSLGSTSTSVSLSSATSNTKTSHATINPSTSLHFSVNTKKNTTAGSQINSGSNVSIHYNSMNSTPNASYSDTGISRAGKGKPRIGNVSHSGNITVRSAPPTGARPKSAQLEEDFPMLQPASKPFVNNVQTPNPLQTKEAKDKILENDENVGGKGKKKKKNISSKVNTIDNDKIAFPTTVPKSVKKKPLQLSNAFENANPDEPMEDFSRGRIGEYEAVVPMLSSNIKVISSVDEMTGNSPKKSELQIGQLKTPDFSAEEFPSLGFGPVPSKSSKATSKLVRSLELPNNSSSSWNQSSKSSKKQIAEPPGFANNSSTSVPPGFANTKMTFTSSLGQNFAISPSSETPQKSLTNSSKTPCKEKRKMLKPPVFILPPNFEQRNNALIDAIRAGCDGNDEKFTKFKNLAAVFRTGQIQGQQYYEKCKQIMGKSMFHSILPELLVLLPDIGKQQEVFDAYRKMDGGQGCQTCFAVCAVCQQVLISDDFSLHMTKHEFSTENYPTLLKTSEKTQQGRK
ncbi:Zinc finger protein [Armadillidium nasatum]|uniref:Zinc finger protein n=1 Tax=Armadillidium nasatum TaxID=96803 RepID=A0A5N5T384_9CRUS|nr:Zinc finger protein [Armadillidium nasatum]